MYLLLIFFINNQNIKIFELLLCAFYIDIFIVISAKKIWHCFVFLFHVSPSFSLYPFILLLSPSPFLFALLAGSFGGALCSIARRDETVARLPKIRFPSRASLRRSVDIAGLLV